MIVVEFKRNNITIKGIFLARYYHYHEEIVVEDKKFLWVKRGQYKRIKLNNPIYLLFIPWKHQEKEIVEIDEKYILNKNYIEFDNNWIKVKQFISESSDSEYSFYKDGLTINDFYGYDFIYNNNSFIFNQVMHNHRDNLTILYNELPEILNINIINTENC